jgi:hypothetical protein
VSAVWERLQLLAGFDFSLSDPWDLVLNGLIDPVKLFVKNEPHKQAKLLEGRLRLIFSMSVIDNVIARMLFSRQNNAEIEIWERIPLKPGMGLTDEYMKMIYWYVKANDDEGLMETDMKGWDWSFQEQDFVSDLERRAFLNGGKGTLWWQLARAHYHCVARKVMVLSNGEMYKQLAPGIMPSGWYNTSSTNSAVRVINHEHAALMEGIEPFIMAMGDDGVERFIPNVELHYGSLGKTCGLCNIVSSDSFEFCSTLFQNGLGVPVNVTKQLYNLLRTRPITLDDCYQRYEQFSYELRHSPDLPMLLSIVDESGWFDLVHGLL